MKPCPFCGSTDIEYDSDEMSMSCQNCHAAGPMITEEFDGEDDEDFEGEALRMWDERKEEH